MYNTEMLQSYLDQLTQRYQDLEKEENNFNARLRVRKEIEGVKGLLEDMRMESTWEQLGKVFNTNTTRPDFDYQWSEVKAEEDTELFRKSLTKTNAELLN